MDERMSQSVPSPEPILSPAGLSPAGTPSDPAQPAAEAVPASGLARRGVLAGGLLLGAWVLAGCNSTGGRTRPSSIMVSNGGGMRVPSTPPQYVPPISTGRVNILPRSAWTGVGIARPNEAYPMAGINRITVHHSGVDSSSLRSQSQCTRQIENIRQAHVRNGWADIGYHFVIDPQGRVYSGRPVAKQGAHVKDENEHNLGIMMMGNYDRQTPSAEAMNSLKALLVMQIRSYRVPLARVYTHQELKPTACPGRSLQRQMVQMRSRSGELALALGESVELA